MCLPGTVQVMHSNLDLALVMVFAIGRVLGQDIHSQYDMAGLRLGKTTQSELARIWHSTSKVEVGEHPHSARRWNFSNALIDTDGRRYQGHVVIVDTVEISAWKGDLSKLLTGGAFPTWMKNLRVGNSLHEIESKVPENRTRFIGQAMRIEVSSAFTVTLRFSSRRLVSLTCSLTEHGEQTSTSSTARTHFVDVM